MSQPQSRYCYSQRLKLHYVVTASSSRHVPQFNRSGGLRSLSLVTASAIRVAKASGSPDSQVQPPARNALLQESPSSRDQHGRLLKAPTGGYTIQAGGPVAQGQSDRLITGWLEVRILPGPPVLSVSCCRAERVADYLRSELPRASEVTAENAFRNPGGVPRETEAFDARWREGSGILEQFVIRPHARTGLTGLADGVGAN